MDKPTPNFYTKQITETKYFCDVNDRFDIRHLTTTTCNISDRLTVNMNLLERINTA